MPRQSSGRGKETRLVLVLVLVPVSRSRADLRLARDARAGGCGEETQKWCDAGRKAASRGASNLFGFSTGALGGDLIATRKYLQRRMR